MSQGNMTLIFWCHQQSWQVFLFSPVHFVHGLAFGVIGKPPLTTLVRPMALISCTQAALAGQKREGSEWEVKSGHLGSRSSCFQCSRSDHLEGVSVQRPKRIFQPWGLCSCGNAAMQQCSSGPSRPMSSNCQAFGSCNSLMNFRKLTPHHTHTFV